MPIFGLKPNNVYLSRWIQGIWPFPTKFFYQLHGGTTIICHSVHGGGVCVSKHAIGHGVCIPACNWAASVLQRLGVSSRDRGCSAEAHPRGPEASSGSQCSGEYASYSNAFLLMGLNYMLFIKCQRFKLSISFHIITSNHRQIGVNIVGLLNRF